MTRQREFLQTGRSGVAATRDVFADRRLVLTGREIADFVARDAQCDVRTGTLRGHD